MASRSFADLHPTVANLAKLFTVKCAEQGITVLITCTYRSVKEQDELYAQGRTSPGRKVTNARGGSSYHNWHCAFDFVPMIKGKPQWDDDYLFHKCGKIAESIGLEWAGSWTGKMRELCHCQLTGGHPLSWFQAGNTLPAEQV